MNYISLHFTDLSPDTTEMASALLMSFGFEGVEMHDDGFTAFINEGQYVTDNLDNALTDWQTQWQCQIDKQVIPPTNWNTEWEKNFSPIRIGNDVYVRAPFHPDLPSIRYEIIIEPKMSFGTGHHATTHMMMEWLLESELKNKTVLDIGTGTGILSILSEKRGSNNITATDNDEWSITNALENTALNGCHHITIAHADNFKPNPEGYDIILANIQRSYFENYLTYVSSLLKPGGLLFTSGYLESDVNIINTLAKQNNLIQNGLKQMGEWVSEMYTKI